MPHYPVRFPEGTYNPETFYSFLHGVFLFLSDRPESFFGLFSEIRNYYERKGWVSEASLIRIMCVSMSETIIKIDRMNRSIQNRWRVQGNLEIIFLRNDSAKKSYRKDLVEAASLTKKAGKREMGRARKNKSNRKKRK